MQRVGVPRQGPTLRSRDPRWRPSAAFACGPLPPRTFSSTLTKARIARQSPCAPRCASSVDTMGAPASRPTVAPYPGPLAVPRPAPVPWEDIILMQGFNWESSKRDGRWYDVLLAALPAIADAGVTHLWLPPPSRSVSPEGYLPTQLYDLNSAYGSRDALLALTAAALAAGVRPVADVVINHRCADEQDADGVWNRFRDDVPHPGASLAWGPEAIAGDDPDFHGRGHADSGADYGPSPDLDHENGAVQAGITDWLLWLRDCVGFEGWRLDFAKGYSPGAARRYLDASLRRPGVDFCVGEYWVDAAWHGSRLDYDQDAARQGVCDWLDGVGGGAAAAFDFLTKAQLQEAVRRGEYDRLRDRHGKGPGLAGWWPSRAVTFVDNHDTGSSQRHWPFAAGRADLGYAYVLTHPGIPCVFWDHYADGAVREAVEALLGARRRAGVRADSPLEILAAEKDLYVGKIRGKGGALVCKLGPRIDMGPLYDAAVGKGATKVASGKDWAVWETRCEGK